MLALCAEFFLKLYQQLLTLFLKTHRVFIGGSRYLDVRLWAHFKDAHPHPLVREKKRHENGFFFSNDWDGEPPRTNG